MIKLYGFDESTPANKVRYLANYLGIDYEYCVINAFKGEHHSEAHIKRHPAGKVPVIEDGEFVLFESNTIMRYLADKASADVYPTNAKRKAVVDQWLDFLSIHVANGINKVFGNRVIFPMLEMPVDEQSLKDGLSFLERFLPVLDAQIAAHEFLAGDALTLADFALIATMDPAELAGIDLSPYPSLEKHLTYLRSEDFYQRCHKSFGCNLANAA